MRLFLGAHFDTIAPARFFSPVCLIPATASPRAARAASRAARSHSIVWTAGDANSKLLPKVSSPAHHSVLVVYKMLVVCVMLVALSVCACERRRVQCM
jgi:hypothetical protein